MSELDHCELHEAAILTDRQDSVELVRLAQSPIGDECQICPVCRYARVFVGLRLAEEAGQVFPTGQDSATAWKSLQGAVSTVRSNARRLG